MAPKFLTFLLISCLCTLTLSAVSTRRSTRRLHIPFLGIGPRCTGCPPHFCDDDPAIVQGYCCGCAAFYDILPVKCSPYLNCPANEYDLCESYEYMMHCCCS